jgi:MoaA/NifB/PqqE/SkfB family radical SAM enzyme
MQLWTYSEAELKSFEPRFLANRAAAIASALRGDKSSTHKPIRFKAATSNKCNIRCIMCYIDFEKTWKQDWYRGDDWDAFKSYLEDVTVFGGEPLVCDVGRRLLLEETWPAQTHLSMVTNGTMLSPEVLATFEGRRIGYVDVSLDSCVEATYERIRRKANYQKVMHNLRELVRLRDRHPIKKFIIQANFVIQDLNYLEMPEFVSFCTDLGIVACFSFLSSSPVPAIIRGIKNGWDVGLPPFRDIPGLMRSIEAAWERAETSGNAATREHVMKLLTMAGRTPN